MELLKGEVSGEHAVCLTFKNISKVTLTALEIHFKCKGVDGVILCEDAFEYRDIAAKPGECFGMDDAVFVTQKAITSVDVSLKNVYNGKRVVHLDGIKRVRLPAPRRLSPELQKALEVRMNREGLKYLPQVFENGWYCACGAFHPTEEDTVYCSECGCDRILLQNALNTLLQPAAPADEYAALLQQLRQVNDAIPDPVMTAKISRLESVSARIFQLAKEDPAKKAQLQKFMDYYLPTALKLLNTYASLSAQDVQGGNITEAKQNIERSMDLLVTAFENQLDKLFQSDALDVSADVAALEGMLNLDGLSGSDFKK